MSLNITKGKWVVRGENVGFIYDTNDQCLGMFEPIAYIEDIVHPDHWEANANLIAEAGTVANECGLTPRQLLEQRDELLEALELADCAFSGKKMNMSIVERKINQAIAKAKGEPK